MVSALGADAYCTLANDCHSHASSVQEVNGQCVCTCRNQWTGNQCQNCPGEYAAGQDCGACAEGYIGTYPNCVSDFCTLADCSNHASSVSGYKTNGCNCVCRNRWQGATCNVCPPNFDQNDDCGSCGAGYANYPTCDLACTIAANCSGNADSVTGSATTTCHCQCSNAWTGVNCNSCPPNVDRNAACGACKVGFIGYPDCERECTNAANCNSRATSVNGTVPRGCDCTCRNKWAGSACQTCPQGYDQNSDCGSCNAGYSGYPNCSRTCVFSDCSNHANSVSGNLGSGCQCSCRNAWSGGACDGDITAGS